MVTPMKNNLTNYLTVAEEAFRGWASTLREDVGLLAVADAMEDEADELFGEPTQELVDRYAAAEAVLRTARPADDTTPGTPTEQFVVDGDAVRAWRALDGDDDE